MINMIEKKRTLCLQFLTQNHSHISCAVLNPTINRPRMQNTNGWDWNPSPNHWSCLLWRKFYYINHWFEIFKVELFPWGPQWSRDIRAKARAASAAFNKTSARCQFFCCRHAEISCGGIRSCEGGWIWTSCHSIDHHFKADWILDWIIQRKPPVTMSFLALSHYFMPISSKTRWTAAPKNWGAHPDHGL